METFVATLSMTPTRSFEQTTTRDLEEMLLEGWIESVSEQSEYTDSGSSSVARNLTPEEWKEYHTEYLASLEFITAESLDAGITKESERTSSTIGSIPSSPMDPADCTESEMTSQEEQARTNGDIDDKL